MKNLLFLFLFIPALSFSQGIVLEKPEAGLILYRSQYTNDFAFFQNIYLHEMKGWKVNEYESEDLEYVEGYRAFYHIRNGVPLFTVLGMFNVPKFKSMLTYVQSCTMAEGLIR